LGDNLRVISNCNNSHMPAVFQALLMGERTIRFPDTAEPLTVKTIYEWKMPDGHWQKRVVAVGGPSPPPQLQPED
jgi:hypothetical protein